MKNVAHAIGINLLFVVLLFSLNNALYYIWRSAFVEEIAHSRIMFNYYICLSLLIVNILLYIAICATKSGYSTYRLNIYIWTIPFIIIIDIAVILYTLSWLLIIIRDSYNYAVILCERYNCLLSIAIITYLQIHLFIGVFILIKGISKQSPFTNNSIDKYAKLYLILNIVAISIIIFYHSVYFMIAYCSNKVGVGKFIVICYLLAAMFALKAIIYIVRNEQSHMSG